MTKYEVIKNILDNDLIVRTDNDGKVWYIPVDESNSDYQRYLRWLENPNADESGTL